MSDEVKFVAFSGNEASFVSTEHEVTFVQVGQQAPSGAMPTAEYIGNLIADATPKTTPVDADSLGLSDSESGGILRKLTWGAFKTAFNGIFARLAGIAGGQTLIGGTGVGDSLTLQGTASSGTTGTDKAVRTLVGDDGAVEAITVLNNGYVGIGQTSPAYAVDIGSSSRRIQIDNENKVGIGVAPNTISSGGYKPIFALATTETGTSEYRCAQSISFTADPTALAPLYHAGIDVLCESKSGNPYNITGGLTGVALAINHRGTGVMVNAVPSQGFAWNRSTGTITYATCYYAAAANLSTGTITDSTVGYYYTNNASTGTIGINRALQLISRNSSSGPITTNICLDAYSRNSGSGTITSNIGGIIKCTNASGVITTNVGLEIGGANSAWSNSGTVTTNTALLIGNSTNFGTNKKAIDCQSTANSSFMGAVGVGVATPSAKVHIVSTTEQERQGYDASNYASYTVSSTGVLTITTTGSAPAMLLSGDVRFDKTITAAGTTGNQTIHKTIGSVNFAAGATSLVVTNSRVSASSCVFPSIGSNDATMKTVTAVAASGSFTLYAGAAPTSETRVNFHVFN